MASKMSNLMGLVSDPTPKKTSNAKTKVSKKAKATKTTNKGSKGKTVGTAMKNASKFQGKGC